MSAITTEEIALEEFRQSVMDMPKRLWNSKYYLLGFALLEVGYGAIQRNLPMQTGDDRNSWTGWGLRHLNLATLNLAQFSLYDGHISL